MLRLLLLVSAATASEQLRGGTAGDAEILIGGNVWGGMQCNKWIDVKPERCDGSNYQKNCAQKCRDVKAMGFNKWGDKKCDSWIKLMPKRCSGMNYLTNCALACKQLNKPKSTMHLHHVSVTVHDDAPPKDLAKLPKINQIDCKQSIWSTWTQCSKTCDVGFTRRWRIVLTYPKKGGTPCGKGQQQKYCNTKICNPTPVPTSAPTKHPSFAPTPATPGASGNGTIECADLTRVSCSSNYRSDRAYHRGAGGANARWGIFKRCPP
jgi:hypothetical protein